MHKLNKSAIVPFTTQQMFELVNAIEDYPRFLPWCHSSQVISRSETEVVASLEAAWKGMHKSFTTRNRLFPYDRVELSLVSGPLKKMDGTWRFHSLDEKACKVELEMTFEFTGRFVDLLFQPIFQHMANTMVDAFCKRAVDLYGTK